VFDGTRTQPQNPYNGLRLLVLGGTGAVGQAVLRLAANDPAFAHVCAPTRRPVAAALLGPHTTNPVVDFDHLDPDADWWQADAVICVLGTTRKVAGSDEAFVAIERDLVLQLSALALHAGVRRCAYVSSLGASEGGHLYLRTKAETEAGLAALDFHSLSIVRPSLIDVVRSVSRPSERIALSVGRLLAPVLPTRWRPVPPERIAIALLNEVKTGHAGVTTLESHHLW
jgi:uncharacterized protein YbjT (DUF2867 family)